MSNSEFKKAKNHFALNSTSESRAKTVKGRAEGVGNFQTFFRCEKICRRQITSADSNCKSSIGPIPLYCTVQEKQNNLQAPISGFLIEKKTRLITPPYFGRKVGFLEGGLLDGISL